jgi:hypothetical protein
MPGSYLIRLFVNGGSAENLSYSRTIIVQDSVKVNNIADLSDNISVYPSITDKYITIEFKNFAQNKIAVYNIYGVEIFSDQYSDQEKKVIDVSGYLPGMYYVKVFDGSNTQVMRFVKQ